jgi:hypothetical protein|tara:strand:- start:638 stop:1015 length:378 start_codon:yes stop_codon:yes gene_type:complete
MSDITLVTPPDRLYTQEYSFLLIYPSPIIKEQFQDLLAETPTNVIVYLYELKTDHEFEWLLDTFNQVDAVILDIDNCESIIRSLSGYFIARNKTYWLTKGDNPVYNIISKNRIFNLDFLKHKLGE